MRMKNTIQSESAGFTLVEIAIVIVIIGLIFAVSIGVFKQYDQAIRLEQSERLIENSRVAIQNFRLATGRYPCPASPAIAPNAPNYGVEDCTLVRTDTIRNVQFMQGMFPFNTPIPSTGGTTPLGQTINSEEIIKTDFLDNWGRPLQYAVTADLAAPPGGVFNPANGALRVVDELGRDTGGTNSDAHYVVFSNGENPCPTIDLSGGSIDLAAANVGSSVSNLESENCIQNTLVTDPMCAADPTLPGCTITGERLGVDATYMAALQGERYDDLISFEHYRNTQAWNSLVDSAGNSTNHITTLDPTSRVGLGTTAPTQTLDVIGLSLIHI